MKEKDDLTVLRLAAGAAEKSAEKNVSTATNSSDEVVSTALLRKLWVRRVLNELGEQCSCGGGLDSRVSDQSDGAHVMHNSFVVGKLTLVAQQLLFGLDEILKAITLLGELPAAQSEAEAEVRSKIEGVLNVLLVRLARAELAAQHVLPEATDNASQR
jgi:hypothetical protein